MSNNSQEILNGLLSKSGDVSMFFDVDGTLKHSKSEHQPQGFHLNLPLVLFNLYQLGQVGSVGHYLFLWILIIFGIRRGFFISFKNI